ncbi:MAG: hypothetical protein ACJ711_00445, partial [Ornithinibacter sp.]
MTRPPLGIIAGTGFYDLGALQDTSTQTVGTAFGDARVTRGTWHGVPIVFLTRHGAGHSVPPHLVNYRANIRALADLGVRDVVAPSTRACRDGYPIGGAAARYLTFTARSLFGRDP